MARKPEGILILPRPTGLATVISGSFLVAALLLGKGFCAESQSIGSMPVFPADNAWNWDISDHAVHPNSDNYVAAIGADTALHPDFGTVWNGAPNGIPYIVVDGNEPLVTINYTDYGNESDAGPFPIPLNAPVEGGPSGTGDRHAIAVDTTNRTLYELFYSFPQATQWDASSGAKFDLASNALRPDGWTSADAAGLPIFPGLVRYEDVFIKGEVDHAIRFTVEQSQRAYIHPATHFASSSSDANLPPMGLRFRLKADYDISGFSGPIQVIFRAFKKYGIIVADNGGDWFISGAPDDRWSDDMLREIKQLQGSDFEAVLTVDANGDPIAPGIRDLRIAFPSAAVSRGRIFCLFDVNGRAIPGPGGLAAVGSYFEFLTAKPFLLVE